MSDQTLYYNMKLFTGTNNDFTENGWFVVDDQKIIDAGFGDYPHGESLPVIDLAGKYVMPGMMNCHTHVVCADPNDPLSIMESPSVPYLTKKTIDNVQELLKAGITFFRDVGAAREIDIEVKKMIDSDEVLGPDCQVSGRPIVMSGGHGYFLGYESDGVDEVIKHTRELMRSGVDIIKFMATGGVMTAGETPHDVQSSYEEMKAGIEEAHKKGKTTAAHAQGTQGIKNAILAGVDSIEHGVYLDDEAIALFLEHDVYLCPTLAAPYFISEAGVDAGIPAYMVKKSDDMLAAHKESFKRAVDAGVKVVLGTDAGTPFNTYAKTPVELQLMVEAGLSPLGALIAATINPAKMMKIDGDFGSLEKGKFADFLVLEENPLDDITVLQHEKIVYKKGKKVTL